MRLLESVSSSSSRTTSCSSRQCVDRRHCGRGAEFSAALAGGAHRLRAATGCRMRATAPCTRRLARRRFRRRRRGGRSRLACSAAPRLGRGGPRVGAIGGPMRPDWQAERPPWLADYLPARVGPRPRAERKVLDQRPEPGTSGAGTSASDGRSGRGRGFTPDQVYLGIATLSPTAAALDGAVGRRAEAAGPPRGGGLGDLVRAGGGDRPARSLGPIDRAVLPRLLPAAGGAGARSRPVSRTGAPHPLARVGALRALPGATRPACNGGDVPPRGRLDARNRPSADRSGTCLRCRAASRIERNE